MTSHPRVLFLTHSLGNGGSERVTVNLANHLAEAGWQVAIVPLWADNGDYPVSSAVDVVTGAPQGGPAIVRGMRKLGFVCGAVRRFRPQVVVSLGSGFEYLIVTRLLFRHRLVTSLRNDPTFILGGKPWKRLVYTIAFALSSRVVFQTSGAAKVFEKSIADKSVVIGNPLREGLVHNDRPFRERRREVVCFGRLLPQKRLDVLINAFAIFHRRYPEYSLTIFGRGPERERLEALASALGLSADVTFEDFRPDIHERIADSAMYVSSSDVEGISNSMLEAMAIGLPAACTDCAPGGARETLERYGTGVLAKVGDPESLANAMIAICEDPDGTDRMISRGVALAHDMTGESVMGAWRDLLTHEAT